MFKTLRRICATRTHCATWRRWQTTSPSLATSGNVSNAGIEVDDKVSGLTDLQIQLRQSVRAFCTEHLAPYADRIDKDNGWSQLREFFRKCGGMGLLGITAEEEYGGVRMGFTEHCVVMEEMSRASGSIALSYGAHSNLCVNQVS
ncbi:Isovaleryl-CoA dehydrogenase, mitochondrial [Oopsacas minuta]|uniref:Isovaleryl-CoA dehydrogenase, mitochondrial n=1 Tax=Oopsacas minuta TaxID=111878 RepID=A0AAV7K4W1_9METZ|nr:Isovaleryl-CoA dehydrogenase, mitochondrial [Oopsacas minuta]KAI6656314.1 Isovaleryl-CoA dehydrogenase, mitochondrial [Oopsacas minuta]